MITEPSNADFGDTPESVREYLAALEQQNDTLRARVAELEGKNHCQSEQLNQYASENEALQEQRDGLAARVEQLQRQKEQIQLGIDDYKRMQNLADAEIKSRALDDFADELVEFHNIHPHSKSVVYAKEKACQYRSKSNVHAN